MLGTVGSAMPSEDGERDENAVAGLQARPYAPGDEAAIVDLFLRCTDWPPYAISGTLLDHWKWKYLGNPLGGAMIGVVERNGRMIAHAAALPARVRIGKEEYDASHGLDVFTDPEFRGLGMVKKVLALRDGLKEGKGVVFDYAVPSDASHYDFSIKSGHEHLDVGMTRYQFISNPDAFFKRVRWGAVKGLLWKMLLFVRGGHHKGLRLGNPDVEAGGAQGFGEDVEDMFRGMSERFDLCVVKDRAYLDWRYADRRGGNYRIRVLRKEGKVAGYSVLKMEDQKGGRYAYIIDMIIDWEVPSAAELLLLDAVERAREESAISLIFWLPSDHPFAGPLRKIGFFEAPPQTQDDRMRFVYRDRSGKEEVKRVLSSPETRYHLTMGDTDWA